VGAAHYRGPVPPKIRVYPSTMMSVREVPERQTRTQAPQEEGGRRRRRAGAAGGGRAPQEEGGRCRRGGVSRCGRVFFPRPGIFLDSAKLSLYDSSHLTAVAPAGKLEPELVNFIHTQLHTHKDCSWHVR